MARKAAPMNRMRLTLVLFPLLLAASTGCDDETVQDAIPAKDASTDQTSDAAHEGGSDAAGGETGSDAVSEEAATHVESDADAAPTEGSSDAAPAEGGS